MICWIGFVLTLLFYTKVVFTIRVALNFECVTVEVTTPGIRKFIVALIYMST